MNTVVKSPTQTVLIGPDQPFAIIGERINPTGRKKLEAEMLAGDFSRVLRDAQAQINAGAHILDINVGVTSIEPHKTEPDLMVKVIELVQSVTDIPLCIDSSVVPALIAGIGVAKGRPIINSVTGEEDRLETILPVVAEYTVYAADMLMGHDPKMNYLMAMRKLAAQQNTAAHGTSPVAPPSASDDRRAARDARRSARQR